MIRCSRDMRSHCDGGEEITGSPLHVDTLQGIGIIAYPELIEVWQNTPVGTTATRSTGLNGKVGILGTNTLANLFETTMVFDIKMTLIVHGKVLRTMIHNGHVGIPLDIIDLRILGHQVIYNREHKVLHLWICQIEYQLRAATTLNNVSLRCFYNPVGMCIVEFGYRVGHLWLNPYAELNAVLLGIAKQTFDTFGQLVGIHLPVAKGAVVGLTRIFYAKPAIVHHKEFASHRGNIAHHLVHTLLVDVEVNTLPRVEQYLTLLIAVSQHIFAAPLVEVTRHT